MSFTDTIHPADNDNEDNLKQNHNDHNLTSRYTEKRRLNTIHKLPSLHRFTNRPNNPMNRKHSYNHENHAPFPDHSNVRNRDSDSGDSGEDEDSLDLLLTEHLHSLADNEHNSNLDDDLNLESSDSSDMPYDDHHHLTNNPTESDGDDGLSFLIDHHSLPEDELNSAAIQLSLLMEADHSSSLLNQLSSSLDLISPTSSRSIAIDLASTQLLNSDQLDFSSLLSNSKSSNAIRSSLNTLDSSMNLISPSFSSSIRPTVSSTATTTIPLTSNDAMLRSAVISSSFSLSSDSSSVLKTPSSVTFSQNSSSLPNTNNRTRQTETTEHIDSTRTPDAHTATLTQTRPNSTLSFVLIADSNEQRQSVKSDSSTRPSNKLEYNVQGETSAKSKLDQELNLNRQVNLFSSIINDDNSMQFTPSSAVADTPSLAESQSVDFIPSSVRRSSDSESEPMLTRIVDNSSRNKKQFASSSSKRKQQKVIIRPILPVDYNPQSPTTTESTPSLPIKFRNDRQNELSGRKIGESNGSDILIDPSAATSSSSSKRVFTKTIGGTSNYDDLNEYIPYLNDENKVDHSAAQLMHNINNVQTTTTSPLSRFKSKFGPNQSGKVSNADSFLARINHKQIVSAMPNYEIRTRTTLFGFAHFTTVISGTEIVFSPSSTSGHQFSVTNSIQPASTYAHHHQPNTLINSLNQPILGKIVQQNRLNVQGIKASKTRNVLIKTKSRIIYRNQNGSNNLLIPARHHQLMFKNNPLAINPSLVAVHHHQLPNPTSPTLVQSTPFQYVPNRNGLNNVQPANQLATPPLMLHMNNNKPSVLSSPQVQFNYVTKQQPVQTKPTFSINVLPNKIKMLPVGIVSTINGPRSIGFNAITEYTTLVIGTYIHGTYAHLLQTTSNVKQITQSNITPQITITSGFILPSHLYKSQFDQQLKPSKSIDQHQSIKPTQMNNQITSNQSTKPFSAQSTKVFSFTPAITVFSTQTHLSTLFKNGQSIVSTRKEIVSSVINPSSASATVEPLQPSLMNEVSIGSSSSLIQPSLSSSVVDENSSVKTIPLSSSKVVSLQSSSTPLELTIYTTLVKDGKTTLSSSIATLTSTIEKLNTDDEIGDSDEEDQLPKPTLTATTTFYTTFTYFTTLYSNGTKMISSNYETITNMISNESFSASSPVLQPENNSTNNIRLVSSSLNSIQPTRSVALIMNKNSQLVESSLNVVSSSGSSSSLVGRSMDNHLDNTILNEEAKTTVDLNSVLIGLKVPITHYTTFTYFTTLFKDSSPFTVTRTEIVSNIVTDTINIKPTMSTSISDSPSSAALLDNNKRKESKNDLLLTSGSQLESHLQLPPTSFGGRLEAVRTPPLAHLPTPTAPIDLDKLTAEQKKQLLLLRPDLFRKKLQTVYTTYTSSKTHLKNGSPSIETLYATVTNVIADGQTPYTVGNSVEQDKFQLPITSSSSHHVILRSRSDAPSVTHLTTITHYTTFAQGTSLVTATRKETRSDIKPNPALDVVNTLAPSVSGQPAQAQQPAQRRPIIIRRTKSRVPNGPTIQATRLHPDQARLAPIVVVTKQNQYATRVQQQLQLQQQQQLRQLAALKQQQIALQKQQQVTIQNHYSQVIRQQQLQRSALNNNLNTELQGRQINSDKNNKPAEQIEVVNHNSKLKELKDDLDKQKTDATQRSTTPAKVNVTTTQAINLLTTTSQLTSTTGVTLNTTEQLSTTKTPSTTTTSTTTSTTTTTTEKPTSLSTEQSLSKNESTNVELSTVQTIQLKSTLPGNLTVTTNSPTAVESTTMKPTILNSTESSGNSTAAASQTEHPPTGVPVLRKRRLLFVELEEIVVNSNDSPSTYSSTLSPTYVHEKQNTSITDTDLIHHLNKPSTNVLQVINTPDNLLSNINRKPEQINASLSLSSDVQKTNGQRSDVLVVSNLSSPPPPLTATAAATAAATTVDINGEQTNLPNQNSSASGMYSNFALTMHSPLLDNKRNNEYLKHTSTTHSLIINQNNKAITRPPHNLHYFEPISSSINSQYDSLHLSVDYNTSTQSSSISSLLSTSSEQQQILSQTTSSTTQTANSELTGLVSTIKSTLMIEELTIVYTTEYYGTFIHGVYAHLAKTKSEVITSTPTQPLFNGIIVTQPPGQIESIRIEPTRSSFVGLSSTAATLNTEISDSQSTTLTSLTSDSHLKSSLNSESLSEQTPLPTLELSSSISSLSNSISISDNLQTTVNLDSSIAPTSHSNVQAEHTSTTTTAQEPATSSDSTSEFSFATGLISQSNSTQIVDGTTSIYNTQVIGTFFNGLYAHIGKVSVSVIQPSQTSQTPTVILKTESPHIDNEKVSSKLTDSSKQPTPAMDNKHIILNYNSDQLSDHAETINGEFKTPLQLLRSSEVVYGNVDETSQPIYTIYHLAKVYKTKIGDFEAQFTVSSSFSMPSIDSTSTYSNEEISRRLDDSSPSIGLLTLDRNRLLNDEFPIDNQNVSPSQRSLAVKPSVHFPRRPISGGHLKRKPFLPVKPGKSDLHNLPNSLIHLRTNGLLVNNGLLIGNEKPIKFTDFDDEYSDNDEKALDRKSIHDSDYFDADYENSHETVARSSSNHPMAKHRLTRDESTQFNRPLDLPSSNPVNDQQDESNQAEMYTRNGRGSLRNTNNNNFQVASASSNRQHQRRFGSAYGERSTSSENPTNNGDAPASRRQRISPYQFDQLIGNTAPNLQPNGAQQLNVQSNSNLQPNGIRFRGYLSNNQQSTSLPTTTTSTTTSSPPVTQNINPLNGRRRYRNRNPYQPSTTTTTTTTQNPLRLQRQNRRKLPASQQLSQQPRGGRLRPAPTQSELSNNEHSNYDRSANLNHQRRRGQQQSYQQQQQNLNNNRRRQNLNNQNTYSTRGAYSNNNFNYDKIQYSTVNNHNGFRQLEPSVLSADDFINKNGGQGLIPTTTLNKIPLTITSLVPIIKTLPIKHGFRTSYATLTTTTYNTSVIRPDQYQTRLDSNNLANTVSIFTEYIDPLHPTLVTQVIITTTAIKEIKQVQLKIGFNTRTDTLTSVQILTTLATNYLSTNGFQTLLHSATAPPGYTIVSTSYPTTVTQLSSFVVSLVLHGKTLLSTLSTSILIPTTIHTYKTVPISPTSTINLNEQPQILTTQLTITLTGDNGDLTQLITAVTIPPNLIQPTSAQQQSVSNLKITADSANQISSSSSNNQQNSSNNPFKFPDGEYIAGAESDPSPQFLKPLNATRQRRPTQSLNNLRNHHLSNNLKMNSNLNVKSSSLSFKYNYTAHQPHIQPTLTLDSSTRPFTNSSVSSEQIDFLSSHFLLPHNLSVSSTYPAYSTSADLLLPPQANYSGLRSNVSNINKQLNSKRQSTSVLKSNININFKGDQTTTGTTLVSSANRTSTTNRTQPQQATRQRQTTLNDSSFNNKSNLRKRPNKKLSEKFAAASLAAAYKQPTSNKKTSKQQTQQAATSSQQPPTFQKRKLFQFIEERSSNDDDDSNEPAAIPLQPNRVRQRLAQRVNVRTAAASNPQVRRLSLSPNFIDSFGGVVNSSPNENPTTRFQRIVNSALTHSTPANSLLNNELLTPNTFNRQPASLPNPLVLDINSFTPNDAANLFANQPSLLNEEHLINLDTPRRQFNRIKPNNALFNPLNSLDFLNPIATVNHNPTPTNNQPQNRRNNVRKPSQASRVRVPSSQAFSNKNEATLNPFLPTSPSRSIDFNNFNSYNVEPFLSRLSAAEISANLPDLSIRIQPSSVLNEQHFTPTASKRLVRVRRPNNNNQGTSLATTPSLPQTTPANQRRRVNVNRNKHEGTQGRGPINNGLYTDEELNYGNNNAIDVDDNLLNNNNNKANAQLEPSRISHPKDESVLVNYQTVFTYLTTVIKGQHTLFTSRLSTITESSTKSVDDELSAQLEKGVVIQPTETLNLGTKTKGATTTIVNMQSQVHVENFKAIPPSLHVTPTVSPLDHNQLQPTRIKLLEKPEIVVDDKLPVANSNLKQTPKLSLEQIKQAARVLQTEYRYIYTVYDNTHTRKSTRNEIVTNTLSQPLDLQNIEIDSTVDPNGYLRLGSVNGEQINLGKRVKSGSTTEVNLQLKTLAKLDGLANHKVEITSSLIQPTRSSSIEQPSSTAVANSRARSSVRVVSSRVSAVDSTQVQPSKSRLAVRIRKPIYSRVPGVSNNRIVSSRVANSRLHLSTSEQPHIEPTKSTENVLATDSLSPSSSSMPNDQHHSKTPSLESSLSSSMDSHLSSTNSIQPTTPISSSPAVDSSSKRRIVTVRKPLTNLNRLRTRRPPFLSSSSDLASETESTSSVGPASTARFSLYSRFTISHHHSSSPSSPVSSSAVSTVSSSITVTPSSSSTKQFPRVRLTSSRVIKSKSSSSVLLDKSTLQTDNINPTLSTIYSTATHTIPFTIGSKTLYTTFEITNSKVEKIDNQQSAQIEKDLQSSSVVQLSSNIQPTSASDLETRTMFTTFTYFTTFYQSGGQSKIVSSESTMSNIITVPVDMSSPSISGVSLSSSILLPEQSSFSVVASSVQPTPSILPIYVTEYSERTETSTILNTVTYFATLYNGTKSTITPIEEVKTELLTLKEPIKITRTIHPLVGGSLQSTSQVQSSQHQSEQPRNVFVRTYYTTYTNPITMFNSNGPSVSNVEEVVSNVSIHLFKFYFWSLSL